MGTLIHFGSPVGVVYEPDVPEDDERPDKNPVGLSLWQEPPYEIGAKRKKKFWTFGK